MHTCIEKPYMHKVYLNKLAPLLKQLKETNTTVITNKNATDLHLFPFFVCCAKEDELEYQQTLHLYVVASPYSAGKSQRKVSHH